MVKKKEQVFGFETPEESPGFLLWQVTNLWQRKIRTGLEAVDLTHVQFVLLASAFWLNIGKEPVTQTRIAEHAKTDMMMTSKVLRTLEDKGLILRTQSTRDSRAKSIQITEEGKKLLARAVKIVEKTDIEFFLPLNKELQTFNQNLKRLTEM